MAKSETHFVYMLLCQGNRLYTGYATDAEARYRKHCAGMGARFTRAFPPLELLCVIPVLTRSEGLKLEAALKKQNRRRKNVLVFAIQRLGADVALRLLSPRPLQ